MKTGRQRIISVLLASLMFVSGLLTATGTVSFAAEAQQQETGQEITQEGTAGETDEIQLEMDAEPFATSGRQEGKVDSSSSSLIKPLKNGINVYLAGDSTCKDYSASGLYQKGQIWALGAWGEFLQAYFDSSKVQINNYANGGRSTRSFINEGSLKKISATIKKGDYLLIQFGHNDEHTQKEEQGVLLGKPDKNGIYPVKAAKKTKTPSNLQKKYGSTWYPLKQGTYKWYLSRYVETALKAGATPVLITPVTRLRFDKNGKICPNHDAYGTAKADRTNSYAKAVRQLYQEYRAKGKDVKLIDMCSITSSLYEKSYRADSSAAKGNSSLTLQAFVSSDDLTHSSKLGGMVQAAIMAVEIKKLDMPLSSKVKQPSSLKALEPDKKTMAVSVNADHMLALNAVKKKNNTYAASMASYWTAIGQSYVNQLAPSSQKFAGPALKSLKQVSYSKLKLTWGAVKGVDGYRIYQRTTGSGWKKVADVAADKKTYTISGLKTGTRYCYTVRAFKKSGDRVILGKYQARGISKTPTLGTPALKKAVCKGHKKVELTWKQVAGASGYAIYRKNASGKWKRLGTTTSAKSVSYTDKDVSRGKKYTYTVRAYRKEGKKTVYSSYQKKGISVKVN